ncbi:pre-rRNA-processing protein TSR1 homolog isoform X2 [Oscarella lobularis]|uniref:pre-rRNA-processing protein TSR1 homolog isoform X2 n=1 Tax=Oscarella lobularis TaxID=121494 RepID=UPI0033141CCF
MGEQVPHRPGPLKQKNKPHKCGKHKTNRSQDKGRVGPKAAAKSKKSVSQRRSDRRNQMKQHRRNKRIAAMQEKRTRGGQEGAPPHIIALIPLHAAVADRTDLIRRLVEVETDAIVHQHASGLTVGYPKMKQRFTIVTPAYFDLCSLLDACKVADTFVFLYAPIGHVDSFGEILFSCLLAQGVPATAHVVQGFDRFPSKRQTNMKKSLQKVVEKRFPSDRIQILDRDSDVASFLRRVATQKTKHVHWRDKRPHLLIEQTQFQCDSESEEFGTLSVSGYVRGRGLSVDGLIHLPELGDFQMRKIDAPPDPCSLKGRRLSAAETMETDDVVHMATEDVRTLQEADPSNQESLDCEAVPDPMDAEQTWPTDEELREAEARMQSKTEKRRVPPGTSEYQATWILTSDQEDESESESEESEYDGGLETEFEKLDIEMNSQVDDCASVVTEMTTEEFNDAKYDDNYDQDKEMRQMEKIKAEKENEMFPDEVDTPLHILAKTRFARYRGLKSFKSSPWDPKENLPSDYARIFQFEDIRRTRKKVLAAPENAIQPGWYVTIHIANVPRSFSEAQQKMPLVAFGLLQHEQKMSVVHFVVKKHPSNSVSVKSKDSLLIHCGFRRFTASPIYSQHTNSSKHKFERFLRSDAVSVASVFAPITFSPAPVLLFSFDARTGEQSLVATGSVLGVDPDRLIIKKVVLSGHPYKIHKRSAVIRYMFFDRADIAWFKPVELHTKYGRRGHIKDSLGTHGHMKCTFDGPLKPQDTICMDLYKRVYPKWTYDKSLPTCTATVVPQKPLDDEETMS